MIRAVYSLAAPREVLADRRPHRGSPISVEQGLALAARGQVAELHASDNPLRTVLLGSQDFEDLPPEWRVCYLTLASIVNGPTQRTIDALTTEATRDELDLELLCAAGLLTTIYSALLQNPQDSLDYCRSTVAISTSASPVTQAVLSSQIALRLAECNDYEAAEEACRAALLLIADVTSAVSDPEAGTVLTGVEGATINTLNSIRRIRSSETIVDVNEQRPTSAASDAFWTVVDTQRGFAVVDLSDELFAERVSDISRTNKPQVWGAADKVALRLGEAWFTASVYAHWSRYRRESRLLGLVTLSRASTEDTEDRERGLALLRISGATKDLKNAIRTLRSAGPISALANEVGRAAQRLAVRELSSADRSDLALVEQASEFLEPALATQTLEGVAGTLDVWAKKDFVGTYRYDYDAWDAIDGLAQWADIDPSNLLRLVLTNVQVADQLVARRMGRIVSRLDYEKVDRTTADEARAWALGDVDDEHRPLASALQYALALNRDMQAASALVEAWEENPNLETAGELTNLSAHVEGVVSDDLARSIVERCRDTLNRIQDSARQGSYSFGGVDPSLMLAILSARYPSAAEWSTLANFLMNTEVAISDKEATLDWLASNPASLPVNSSQVMAIEVSRTLEGPDEIFALSGGQGPGLRFGCAFHLIQQEAAITTFLDLSLSDEDRMRHEAAKSAPLVAQASSAELVGGVLLQLSKDTSLVVRAAAYRRLSALIRTAEGAVANALLQAVQRGLGHEGVSIPAATLQGLVDNVASMPQAVLEGLLPIAAALETGSLSAVIRGNAMTFRLAIAGIQ